MLAQEMRLIRVVATEVEELQGQPVHLVGPGADGQVAMVEVPIGHVAAGVAGDDAVEDPGHEVDPSLIDEAHVAGIDIALTPEALHPEVQEGERRLSHPDEAEVVDSGGQYGRLRRHLAVVWHRSRHVGGEDDAVLLGPCGDVFQPMEDLDVRVDVQNRCEVPAEEGGQEPRLHRRGELHHRIGQPPFRPDRSARCPGRRARGSRTAHGPGRSRPAGHRAPGRRSVRRGGVP